MPKNVNEWQNLLLAIPMNCKFKAILGRGPFLGMPIFTQEWQFS